MRRLSSSSSTRCHPERSEGSHKRMMRYSCSRISVIGNLCEALVSGRFLSRACGIGLTALAAASLSAQQTPESPSAISREVKDVFERCAKAVVKIEATDQHGELSGTGFFVDPMGTLYTAYSVGGEAENVTVEFKGKKYPARQLLADLRSGIAMLKVDLASPALPIGSSEQLEIATPVVAIGYPLDLAETPSFGMIAGFDRKCFGGYFPTKHLRVNLPPQRGEGGAPLLNFKGEVVGILLYTFENNSCYALTI